jgi:hypothetical protein
VFKRAFHEGDLEPGAQSKYAEAKLLLKAIEQNEMHNYNRAKSYIAVIDFLDLSPSHKHVIKDMALAYIAMCPFFPNLSTHSLKEFYDSEHGTEFRNSELLNPKLRAQTPDRRRHDSNRYMPLEFWSEWSRIYESRKAVQKEDVSVEIPVPVEWEVVTRPILAKCK